MKLSAIVAIAAAASIALAEAGLHLAGVVDIPAYRPDEAYGYIPRANQSGAFLDRNRWVYNGDSMGVGAPFEPGGVLLIGDSIVNGGNQTDQPDRLGPQLQKRIARTVWPISAGSWALLNELAYLRRNPTVARGVDEFVFVLNSGDFGAPSVWHGDPEHPPHRPISALYYLFDRLVLGRVGHAKSPATMTGRDWRAEFAAFRRSTNKPVLVVLYLEHGEDSQWMEKVASNLGGNVLRVDRDPRWALATYRDRVHVDVKGTALLADLIAAEMRRGDRPDS